MPSKDEVTTPDAAETQEDTRATQLDVDTRARELLDNIAEVHSRLKNVVDKGGIAASVRVTTAVPMDDHLRAKVEKKAEELLKSPVYLSEDVDPSILGGIIIEAPTRRYDASVRSQLANVRRSLGTVRLGEED